MAEKTSLLNTNKLWTMYYHFGNTIPQTLNFPHNGSMSDAAQRAREHCVIMSYRFIKIRPFIVDFEDRERRKKAGDHVEETLVLNR